MKKFFSKKMVAAWIIGLIVGLYTTFVGEQFWNWFAVPVFQIQTISFLRMWGLMMLAGVFVRGNFQTGIDAEKVRWATFCAAIEKFLPDEKKAIWQESWQDEPIKAVFDAVELIFGTLGANTFALLIGYILHLVISG
jgi:uncharacterized membrane protein YraQ (UPF0718 family)